jgi:pantetheine-phosphate adenylyltransferase
MKVALYPGTFDPVTNGHMDVIKRSSKLIDKVIVGVLHNPAKSPLFSVQERVELLKEVTKDIKNVEVDSFSGLLVDYARKKNVDMIIRGLRAMSDFEYEFQMALMNRKLNHEVETFFMITSTEYSYLSSSIVKEVFQHKGCINDLVPDVVIRAMEKKQL